MRVVVDCLPEGLEVLVLDDARIGDFPSGIVNHGVALIIGTRKNFVLESYRAILQLAEAIAVELVDLAGEDDLVGDALPILPILEEIRICASLNPVQQSIDQLVLTVLRNALVFIVEVVVVIDEPDGQSFDNECRELGACAAPLLFCIAFDEFLVDVPADQ